MKTRYLLALLLTACQATDTTKPLALNYSRGVEQQSYIVVLKSGDPKAFARAHGVAAQHIYTSALRGFSARLSPQAALALSNNPNVEAVETDGIVTQSVSWNLDRVDQRAFPLNGAYQAMNDGAGVRIYIVDSGIRYTHTEFQGRASTALDLTGGDGSDCTGHGTHVAGIAGGATYGVAKAVNLVSVRVFDCSGNAPNSRVIAALDWIAGNAVQPAVVNMSLSGDTTSAGDLAVQNVATLGIPVVVAAGNDTTDACRRWPAGTAQAITVGASWQKQDRKNKPFYDVRAYYSNYGNCIDVWAPGHQIISAGNENDVDPGWKNGTSMAAPHVAGLAAMLLKSNPAINVDSAIKAQATAGVVTDSRSQTSALIYVR